MSLPERRLHVDDTLVAGPTEAERLVTLFTDEGTIHQHIDKLQQGALPRVGKQLLESKARVAPDVLLWRALMDSPCQLDEALGLVHRVAAAEGHALRVGVGLDDTHHLVSRHRLSTVEVPRLRIMTACTLMPAACTIDGGPEARTIHHRILDNTQHTYHVRI